MVAHTGDAETGGAPTKRKVGRPTAYNPDIHPRSAREMACEGKTSDEIAKAFGISRSAFFEWKSAHPEFSDAVKQGNRLIDGMVVESLFRRAMGYSHPDVHIAVSNGEVIKTDIIKHYPPDSTALIFWLKNRDPRNWRDKIEISAEIEHKMGDAEMAIAFAQSFKATAPIMSRVVESIEMRTLPAAEAQGTATIAPVVDSSGSTKPPQ